MLGEAYHNLREPRLAEKYYLEALAIRPDYPHLLIVLGNLFMGTSRAAQALACFEHAARVNPQNEIAAANAGIVLAAMGKLDESRVRFETSRRLNPGLWLSHYYLGQIAEAEGRRTEARELYERALKLDPANPRIKASLAQLGAD
jgi:tetratricopeptide (TPR) repeat protein